jgi:hypothetical protein
MTVERREEVRVSGEPGYEKRVVVEQADPVYEQREDRVIDPAAGRRTFLARLAALVYLFFGIVITLIGVRIVLLLIGANMASDFGAFVYNVTNVFLSPFFGLTNTPAAAAGVLEIPSFIAMFVYAFAAWVIVYLLRVLFAPSRSESRPKRVTTYRRDG